MQGAPCGRPDCPIVDPDAIDRRSLRLHTFAAGTSRFRVARTEFGSSAFAPLGVGNGRFSPLDGRGHTYVAEQRSAAVLESALHEAAGPNPRIYAGTLAAFGLYRLRFDTDVQLVDLRDAALTKFGLHRGQLTGADPIHYPCTRRVAETIVGTKRTAGFVWTSRQGALHAERNPDGLASEVLRHDSLDVAVLYQPDTPGPITLTGPEPLVVGGSPTRFVVELANLLRIAIL
ncbi:MAG: RES domain-containing protein [Ilumatobacter sp.]